MKKKRELFIFSNINSEGLKNYFDQYEKFSKTHISSLEEMNDLNIKDNSEKHFIIIPLLENILSHEEINKSKFKNIDKFLNTLLKFINSKSIILISPITIKYNIKSNFNLKNSIETANLSFAQKVFKKFELYNNLSFIDHRDLNLNLSNLKYWFMGKVIFDNLAIQKIYSIFKKLNRYLDGDSIKLIISDLDNTLWRGVIGDDKFEDILIGGHDSIGEAYLYFQNLLKNLKDRGLMLAISSKNEIETVKRFFKFREDMPLKLNDFIIIKSNWESKSLNIKKILKELNILPKSTIFIDDNPIERDEVKKTFRDMKIPNFPENILEINKIFDDHIFESQKKITAEDKRRLLMLRQEDRRIINKKNYNDNTSWLKSLNTEINILKINKNNLSRAEQLYRKVNQFNSTTRRLNSEELYNESKKNRIFLIQVSDKFGDSGITAIINLSYINESIVVNDFIMSCRIAGRKVENILFYLAIEVALKKKCKNIIFSFNKSEKNKPLFQIFKNYFQYERGSFNLVINKNSINLFKVNYFKSIKLK